MPLAAASILMGLLGGKSRKILLLVTVCVFVFGGGTTLGYKYANNKWKAKEAELMQEWAESMKRLDEEHRKRERELIEQNKNTRVQVREVVREIPKYITPDGCSITPDGLRNIKEYVQQLFPDAK